MFGSDALQLVWVSDKMLPPPSTQTIIAHWQLREIQYFMLAQSTLRCIITMSGRDSQQERSAWLMCQHKTMSLQIFSQRICLVRSSKLFAKLWACSLLWIDLSHRDWALPYTWVPAHVHRIIPRGGLLPYYGSDVCEHT